jgi:putative endonuclease
VHFLVHYEKFGWIQQAIAREKELKKLSRENKDIIIKASNPEFKFLNYNFEGQQAP